MAVVTTSRRAERPFGFQFADCMGPVFFEDPPVPPPPTPPAPPAPTPPPTPPTPPPTPPTPPPSPDLVALQAELDRAKAGGSSEALAPLMTAIGVETPQALQEWVTARQAELDAGKDEATRLREAAQREAAEARAQAAQAAADARSARLEAAFARAGAPDANIADLVRLIDVPADADAAAITTAVEAVKVKYPAMFAATGAPPAPPGRPPTPPPAPPASDPFAAGKERAAKTAASRQGATKEDLLSSNRQQPSPLATTA